MKYITRVNEKEYVIEIDHEERISVDDVPFDVDFQQSTEGGILSLLLNNHSLEALVEEREDTWAVLIRGELYSVKVQDERAYRLAKARGTVAEADGEVTIRSPMPGLIIAVPVQEGQAVAKGDKIVILESMKMENELRAPRAGLLLRVAVEAGASVEKDQVLAVIGDSTGANESEPDEDQP